jgi:putative transposase
MCSSTVDRSSGVALSPLARRASSSPLASMKRNARPTGIAQSMGSRGDCYDNAVAESFFATLKKELIHGRSWPSKAELRTEVFEYIEVCFNRRRQHSTLGFLPPEQFETITNHHHLKERQPA